MDIHAQSSIKATNSKSINECENLECYINKDRSDRNNHGNEGILGRNQSLSKIGNGNIEH